jgi:kumamolisin
LLREFRKTMLALVAAASIATVVGQAEPVLTRHVRPEATNGKAKSVGHLPASQTLRLVITLPLRNQDELDQFLKDVYDPTSASYRHFLTVEEFTARFGPAQEDYASVVQFAQENGLTVVGTSRNRLNVDVTGTVTNIEKAFHLTLGTYQHPTDARTFYAPDREPTPSLGFSLWHISGLDNYSIPQPAGLHKKSGTEPSATTGSGPSASFLGSDMRAAYYGGSLTGAGQSLGLLEYYGTDLADLTTYFKNAGQTNNVPVTLISTDGTSTSCVSPGCDDTEQTLDMTQAIGMAPGLSSLAMYVGSTDAAIFNSMATHSPLNAQLSSSWTWYPADPATDNPYFQEFAAQGQNLFQAAGDSGKWTATGSGSEIFPADDVYVTTVGGTDLSTSSAAGPWKSETAWADSGGGISPNKFAIPSWQATTASACSACSKSYRNAPDVSANANFTFYVCADQKACTANLYGGTSFAAPMWAGYLALANQQSVANGTGLLGFINPTLYSIGESGTYTTDFHDITSGSNGYSATSGYDLATGWGSPNGAALINALSGPVTPGFSLSASPASVSVVRGNAGSSTITSAVAGGFGGAITLSASGQPTGVTVGFGTNPINGAGSSSMSITVGSSVAAGTYPITVTGTSGSIIETTTVNLTVTAAGATFTLTASPTSISAGRNGSASSTITATVSGTLGTAITFSGSGQGSGNSVTFSPTSLSASGTTKMTVKVGKKATLGTYTITITGTSGTVSHQVTVTLKVT